MKISIAFYLVFFLFGAFCVNGQTVGTIINSADSWQGYTLLSPLSDSTTYLIDNCGQVINTWEANYAPGNNAFLDQNGNLFRAGENINPSISNGGAGGVIEKFDWDNNLLWSYVLSDSLQRLHHDFELLPNGNLLAITWEKKDSMSSIQAGRNPALLTQGEIWIDKVIEIQPSGINSGIVVWEWSAWDHLVQDFDNTKDNFGDISNSPRKLNINAGRSIKDWMHCNALDYNADKDMIALSCPEMNEIYFIDHSVTTIEASGSSGGNYGFGGDFLWRWGNSQIYGQGVMSDQELFYQHDVSWIPSGMQDAGKLMLFNNRLDSSTRSAVYVIAPDTTVTGEYALNAGLFGPANASWSYDLPPGLSSNILSGAQRLPNGNTLICSGRNGRYIEINELDTIVWKYVLPVTFGAIIEQGNTDQSQFLFNSKRYSEDFSGFIGKNLTPGPKIEINPINNCTVYNNEVRIKENNQLGFELYPNPANQSITVISDLKIVEISLLDMQGRIVYKDSNLLKNKLSVDIQKFHKGVYLVIIETASNLFTKRLIVD
ncbi:MAG: aryl-sulfate sulfotransferase [Flavobacteriales bacterium]|nr:aryl-sulfate sulfotransferase [Flavobacteriales bacterium]